MFNECKDEETEGEYSLLIQHLGQYMDTRILDRLEVVRTPSVLLSPSMAATLMSSFGKASHKKNLSRLYANLIGDIPSYIDGQTYCVVNHKSSDTCCLFGPPDMVYYVIEHMGRDNFPTIFFDEYGTDTGVVIAVIIPARSVFCEIEIDD